MILIELLRFIRRSHYHHHHLSVLHCLLYREIVKRPRVVTTHQRMLPLPLPSGPHWSTALLSSVVNDRLGSLLLLHVTMQYYAKLRSYWRFAKCRFHVCACVCVVIWLPGSHFEDNNYQLLLKSREIIIILLQSNTATNKTKQFCLV